MFMKLLKFFVYIQVYVMDYDITNKKLRTNISVLVGSERELESNNIAEVK